MWNPLDLVRKVVARYLAADGRTPYAGIFLDAQSQRHLLNWWDRLGIPLHQNVKAHHMTIKFKPTPEETAEIPVGLRATVQVIGYAADEKGQAVLVRPSYPSKNRHAHVTISVVPGISAAYSNELLARGHTPIVGPKLSGVVDIRTE